MARVAPGGAACSLSTSPEFAKRDKRPKYSSCASLSGPGQKSRAAAAAGTVYGNGNCLSSHRCETLSPVLPVFHGLHSCSGRNLSAGLRGLVESPCRQFQVPVEHLLEIFHDSGHTSNATPSSCCSGSSSRRAYTPRMENPSMRESGLVLRQSGSGRRGFTTRTENPSLLKEAGGVLKENRGKPAVVPAQPSKSSTPFAAANGNNNFNNRGFKSGSYLEKSKRVLRIREPKACRLGEHASSSPCASKGMGRRKEGRLHVVKSGNLNGSPSGVLEADVPPSRVVSASNTTVLAPGEEDLAVKCAHVSPDAERPEPPPLLRLHPDALQYEEGVLGAITGKTAAPPDADCLVDPSCTAMGYLRRILTSRVYDVAIESPLEPAPRLSESVGTPIFLKREDMQQVFSFKLRGAYNMMAQLPSESLAKGVIASSAGNHAQGVALSARKLGCTAIIAMPVTTPDIKWRSVQRLGAEVVLVGDSYDETQTYAKKRAADEGLVFIPPFDHPDVIAGQGTVGLEIIRQHPGPLHAIFVPVGGGGLIAGIAAYVKRLRPEVRVIGVEPMDANAMALSLERGQRVMLEQVGGFADGVAVRTVGEETFRISRELVDGIVLVTRDSICAAIKDMFEEKRSILEPAGALALAGAKAYCRQYGLKGESVVAVTSGANMNFDRLRLVTDLANVGLRREAVLATTMPEGPGAFKNFCHTLGTNLNITEFKYRYADDQRAHVLYSVGLHRDEAVTQLIERMGSAGMPTLDMTSNDLAKDHLRHLVGGRTSAANEVLYRFVFPERPGALMKFLDMLSPRWNITLFHYRAQGEMGANVLVGIQVPPEQEADFRLAADTLGYSYQDERANEAFLMFMR